MVEHDKEEEQEREQEQEEKRKKGNSESSHNSSELNEGDGEGVTGGGFFVREQDRLLPIANVGRIMRSRLPGNAKISKEAKQTMQECVSEFISFVTGEASDRCHKEKRKTINGDDILWAMSTLGFDDYAEPLKIYLQRFRLHEADKFYSATATATSSCLAAAAASAPPASASNNNNNTSSSILLHSHNHNLHLLHHHHHHSFSSSSSSASSSSPLFSGPNHRPQNHHQQR